MKITIELAAGETLPPKLIKRLLKLDAVVSIKSEKAKSTTFTTYLGSR